MALKVQPSFSAGELDPRLHERTTLAKYATGLKTGRNIIIGKNGGAMSRMGRKFCTVIAPGESEFILFSPPDSGYLLAWGTSNVYVYTFDENGTLTSVGNAAHGWTWQYMEDAHFDSSGKYVYVFAAGKTPLKLDYTTVTFASNIFDIPSAPTNGAITAAGTTGYYVDYAVTYVKAGQESAFLSIPGASTYKLPINAGESNSIDARCATTIDTSITEMRVYRRPQSGGAYGYIGSTTYFHNPSATNYHGTLTDNGQAADYTKQPPGLVTPNAGSIASLQGRTGTIYKQCLLLTDNTDKEAILSSRPGFQNNFYRNFPLDADSALKFKSGTSGYAQVLRMIENDGLVVFTTNGIWVHLGALSPTNLSMDKKGEYKINVAIPPIAVPSGLFFVDDATNTIRNLYWSTEANIYLGDEVSIFSNHLFTNRGITSWAFQHGSYPILWVTFDDGTFASFTYQFEQEMRAWTRHDSRHTVLQVCETKRANLTFFLMNSGSRTWIECTIPRRPKATDYVTNPEVEMGITCAAMDCVHSWSALLEDDLVDDSLTRTLIDPLETIDGVSYINGQFYLECQDDGIFTDPGNGEVGTIFRWFDPDDQTAVDLEVVQRVNDNKVVIEPSAPITASKFLSTLRIYKTATSITGISSVLNGSVSMIVDGAVVASPNNDIDNYSELAGDSTIDLPDGLRGAIIHVGHPYTMDVETLDVDTVEQAPSLIESITCNKLYVKVHETRGLFIGSEFPEDDLVSPMQPLDSYILDYSDEVPILGNRYKTPITSRLEITLPGDWKSQGRIAMRQVDPLHFEILSIIPDLTVERRSDR